jgi:uncharacterized protein (TIGR03435 family)
MKTERSLCPALAEVGGLMIVAAVAFGQGGAVPAFEVVSVRPAAPQRFEVMLPRGGPGTPDPENVAYTNVSLMLVMTYAYGLGRDRLIGPSWLDSERYDINAKVPPGTSVQQFKMMLQALMAERFGLRVHREARESPVYNLVLAKEGPKLREAPEGLKPLGGAPLGGLSLDRDGFPQLPLGTAGLVGAPEAGWARLTARGQPISALVQVLSTRLGQPVVDKTGLTGQYDFNLEFSTEGLTPLFPGRPPAPAGADSEGGPSLFGAVQKLGLRLERGRAPLEMLIIDHLDRVPTEN